VTYSSKLIVVEQQKEELKDLTRPQCQTLTSKWTEAVEHHGYGMWAIRSQTHGGGK
jgi:hypothetical protein